MNKRRSGKRSARIPGKSLICAKLPAGDLSKLYLIRAEAGQAETAATSAESWTYLNIYRAREQHA